MPKIKRVIKKSVPVKKKNPLKKAVKKTVRKISVAKKIKKIMAKKPAGKKQKNIIGKKPEALKKKPAPKKTKIRVSKKIVKATKKAVKKPAGPVPGKSSDSQENSPGKFSAESLFKAKIKVLGVGGGGGSIVSEIGKTLSKATFTVADTDMRALNKRRDLKYFLFGESLTRGLGTGMDVDLARRAAEESKEKISAIFKDQDIVIFIASLGGGVGSGATQIFAEAARNFGGITLGIFTMPFKFEGANKHRIAQNALKNLRQALNVSLVIPNEKIFKVIDENTAITQAFSLVNKSLVKSLESLIDLIYNPGVINIDFADLRAILKGSGNSAFLNTVEESGKNRAEKICQEITVNPLLQNTGFEAEKILFNIASDDKLSMFEVDRISRHIAELNPDAKIIFGISKNSKLKNRIKTTILMTGGGAKAEPKKQETKAEKPADEKPKRKPVKKAAKAKQHAKKVRVEEAIKEPALQTMEIEVKESESAVLAPVFVQAEAEPVLAELKEGIKEEERTESGKKTIRRSALEIKKAEERAEKRRIAQEKEWEIPAFLRKKTKI